MRHSRSDWAGAGVGKGVSEGGNTRRSGGKAAFVLFMCLINFRLCCCENEVWKCNRRTVCGKLVENRPSKSVAAAAFKLPAITFIFTMRILQLRSATATTTTVV